MRALVTAGAVVLAAGAVAGLVAACATRQGADPARRRETLALPEFDAPSPAAQAELVFSTRTWRAYGHGVGGIVEVYRQPDGASLLRLAAFDGVPGTVSLSPEPYDEVTTVSGITRLGPLPGTSGSRNYAIPASADLSQVRSLVIWPVRGVRPVAAAPLAAGHAA